MKPVRAGLEAHVHDRSRFAAEFRRRIGLHIEFLDGIDGQDRGRIAGWPRRIDDTLVLERLVIIQPVHEKVGVLSAKPVALLRIRSATGLLYLAGSEYQQSLVVASIQREVGYGGSVQCSTDRGACRVQQGHGFGYLNGLRDLTGTELKVNSSIEPDLHHDASPLERLEAHGRGTNKIVAGRQIGSVVFSRSIRTQIS
jgi:hypothetical protein